MYLPPPFKANDPSHACELMRNYPFATLVSTGDDGFAVITHLPLHLEVKGQGAAPGDFRLLGHVAKANPHWRLLQARPQALVSFLGPYAYMSPKVYADPLHVPTWSYLAVQCQVAVTLIEDPLGKDRLLKKLIGDHEPAYVQQWLGLPVDFQQKLLAGIVAFELQVTQMQTKLKLNQHRPETHAAMHAMYAQGNPHELALADWMVKLGMAS